MKTFRVRYHTRSASGEQAIQHTIDRIGGEVLACVQEPPTGHIASWYGIGAIVQVDLDGYRLCEEIGDDVIAGVYPGLLSGVSVSEWPLYQGTVNLG